MAPEPGGLKYNNLQNWGAGARRHRLKVRVLLPSTCVGYWREWSVRFGELGRWDSGVSRRKVCFFIKSDWWWCDAHEHWYSKHPLLFDFLVTFYSSMIPKRFSRKKKEQMLVWSRLCHFRTPHHKNDEEYWNVSFHDSTTKYVSAFLCREKIGTRSEYEIDIQ